MYSFSYYTITCNKLINMFFLQSLKPKTSKTPFALVTDRKTIHRPPCFADWRAHRTRSWRITMSSSQLWQFFCSHIVAWLHDMSKVYVLWIEAVLLFINLVVYWVIFELLLKPHEWIYNCFILFLQLPHRWKKIERLSHAFTPEKQVKMHSERWWTPEHLAS